MSRRPSRGRVATGTRSSRTRGSRAAGLIAAAVFGVAGCGGGPVSVPGSSAVDASAPAPTAGGVAAQTRGVIVAALASVSVQFGNATRPYRPAESGRLRGAPRAVYQVVLPDQPDAGFIVVYEFRDNGAAVDAGNEEAGYLGTGNGQVQFPPGTRHVLRALGPTLILYSWHPAASDDPTAGKVADALNTIGIGFTVPN